MRRRSNTAYGMGMGITFTYTIVIHYIWCLCSDVRYSQYEWWLISLASRLSNIFVSVSPKKSGGETSVFSQHHSLFNVAIIPQHNNIRRFEGGDAISIHIAEWTRNWALVSCAVHVKCLLQCHLHSFPFPPTAAEHAIGTGLSQSNLSGSISGMALNRPGQRPWDGQFCTVSTRYIYFW